jgi:pSer/pThr/pTyr-binding forkhead associated (FHA) protein
MAQSAYFVDWFPNKPVELKPDKTYHIGRGGGNEFYLPDYHASRNHAEIRWNGKAFVLKDLGSSNGTFVNGEKVDEKTLAQGDEIQIGTHVLALRVEDSGKVEEEFERQSKEVQEWKTVLHQPAEGGLSGTIEDVELSQIVQVLEGGHKTGRLYITLTGASGSVYFKNGRIVAADYANEAEGVSLQDQEAAYVLFVATQGVFEFLVEPIEVEPRIAESPQALLMEAFRRADEKKRAEGGQDALDTLNC